MAAQDEEPFSPEPPPTGATSPSAKGEEAMFGLTQPPPNTFVLPLGRRGHISWHSESSTAVLGVIVLAILAALTLVLCLAALFASDKAWLPVLVQALGSALATVSGAIVGATASGNRRKR